MFAGHHARIAKSFDTKFRGGGCGVSSSSGGLENEFAFHITLYISGALAVFFPGHEKQKAVSESAGSAKAV